jgi:diamine N-acetyltransferase
MTPANATDPPPVQIFTGGCEQLDQIEPLWLQLRQNHAARFPIWRSSLLTTTFAMRKGELLRKSSGGLLVLLAKRDGDVVAYCVCSVDEQRHGEVDSIFVSPQSQRCGIGTRLMTAAMTWMEDRGVQTIGVDVMAGNEDALALYARFGFHPRTIQLRKSC